MDAKAMLCKDLEYRLVESFQDGDIVRSVMDQFWIALNDYTVDKACTDLVVYDDVNARLIKRFSACMLIDGKSKKTIYQYVGMANRLADCVNKDFPNINVNDIRYFLAVSKECGDRTLSNTTIRNYKRYISTFFEWMEKDGIIDSNPCKKISTIKVKKKVVIPFSDLDIYNIRRACETEWEKAIVEIFLSTGMRINEFVNLDCEDINFQNLSIYIREGKGNKERIVYMNELSAVHLRNYLIEKGITHGALHLTQRGRACCSYIRDEFKAIGKRARVSKINPHRFRHTFATNMAKRGMDIKDIQKLMGHENIQTTLGYIYMDDSSTQNTYRQHAM